MDISFIIVNYKTRDLLRNCLHSVHKTVHGIVYEMIVVDNASDDSSIEMLKKEFPNVRIIANKENKGFAAAVNQGLRIMKGRYALLLNTDTILFEEAIAVLFSFLENHPEAAMACGQLRNADGSKQNSIGNFPTLITLLTNASLLEYIFPTRYPSKRHEYQSPIEIDSGIGACLIVCKEAIDKVGMLDERFFFFFEETDWARSMKTAGWKIYFVPTANIYHLQGQSIGKDIRPRIEFYRSRYSYFRKWSSFPYFLMISSVVMFRLALNCFFHSGAVLATLALNPKIRIKWVQYCKLIAWHLKGCPDVRK